MLERIKRSFLEEVRRAMARRSKIRFQVASLGQKKMELKREGREKTKHMQLTTTTQVLFSLSVINSSH